MSRNPRIAKIKAIVASRVLNETNNDGPVVFLKSQLSFRSVYHHRPHHHLPSDPFGEFDDDSSESFICNTADTDSDSGSEGRTHSKMEKYSSLSSTRHVSRLVTCGNLTNASPDPDYDKENIYIPETPSPVNRSANNTPPSTLLSTTSRLVTTEGNLRNFSPFLQDYERENMYDPETSAPAKRSADNPPQTSILNATTTRLVTEGNLANPLPDPDYGKEIFDVPRRPVTGNRLADNLQDTSVSFYRSFSEGTNFPNSPVVVPPTDCLEISPAVIDLPVHDDSGEIPCSQYSQRTTHNNSPSVLDQSTPDMLGAISIEQLEAISTPTENQLEAENLKKTRNKRSAPETWKQNVRKCLKQSGKEYVSLRGKKVDARKVRPKDCSSCPRKCNQSFEEDAREMIHNAYWNLKDSDKQKQYVSTLVDEVDTKVKTAGENSRRNKTRVFFFYKGNGKVQVCQGFFLKTLDISEGFLRNVLTKRDEARIVAPSKRGKHQPGVTRPSENKEIIEKHILSFPTVPSHYCRKKTNYKYLPEDLSLRDMYNLYIKQCTEQNAVPEKFWLYRQIFNNQNLKFHKPRKDLCDSCVKYKNCSEEEKPGLFPLHMQHIRRKIEARQYHDDNKNLALNKVLNFIEIDLEAVRYCPKVSAKAIFYKRRLAVYNATVYDVESRRASNFMWHEGIASRGSNELSSCLYKYLVDHANGKKIIIMSDTCGGQNRNVNLAAVLLYAVQILDIPEIEQGYFEPGHSMMEVDSVHAHIETSSKNVNIYHPSGWYTAVRMASKSSKYEVIEMGQEMFFNAVKLREQIIKNKKTDTDGNNINWLKITLLKYLKGDCDHIYFKYSKSDTDFKKSKVIRRVTRGATNYDSIEPIRAYDSPMKISPEKIQDLLSLCEQGLIPSQYHRFYEELNNGSSQDTNSESSD